MQIVRILELILTDLYDKMVWDFKRNPMFGQKICRKIRS
ncbi:hypothetical protein LEP1GSC081_1534 [Leptospira kirschneri str. H1]|uniref:Uncharacterized protein n=1 Tax=Leptospira kirschneri str. H1 TaxID=1049966 RepID=A0A0E2B0J7_9LEPT|nr:hypothetical protein LEP1GSC081_1534 [Leptospira kirschneri str. H1]